MQPDSSNIEQRLRFNLLLAICLVHELCHAVEPWYYRQRKLNSGMRTRAWNGQDLDALQFHGPDTQTSLCKLQLNARWKEPLYLNNIWRENGDAWEFEVFGGAISSFHRRVDGEYGLSFKSLGHASKVRGDHLPLPMVWVQRLQLEEFWYQSPQEICEQLKFPTTS